MKSLSFAFLMLLALVAGCEQVEPTKVAPVDDVAAPEVEVKPQEPVPTATRAKPVAKVKAESAVLALAPAELDLSLPEPLSFEPAEKFEEPKLLPQLVRDQSADDGYQLSGRIISGDKGDDYWDSVEGAEIKIEIRH